MAPHLAPVGPAGDGGRAAPHRLGPVDRDEPLVRGRGCPDRPVPRHRRRHHHPRPRRLGRGSPARRRREGGGHLRLHGFAPRAEVGQRRRVGGGECNHQLACRGHRPGDLRVALRPHLRCVVGGGARRRARGGLRDRDRLCRRPRDREADCDTAPFPGVRLPGHGVHPDHLPAREPARVAGERARGAALLSHGRDPPGCPDPGAGHRRERLLPGGGRLDRSGRSRHRHRDGEASMTARSVPIRRGAGYWWASYVAMLRWVLAQQKALFGMILFIQLVMGVGSVAMYRFYLGEVDSTTATYLVSGLPALAIIPVGFVMVPILVMQEKFRGTFDFTWSLPVPRLAPVAATFTVFTAIGLPVAALTTAVAAWQFDATIRLSWLVVLAALLSALTATSAGYGMAMAIPEPRLTNLITNVVIFLVLLFLPIVIPIERFPEWAQAAHQAVPFYHMANLIRAGLTEGLATDVGSSLAVLGAWAVGGWAAVAWVVGRRR